MENLLFLGVPILKHIRVYLLCSHRKDLKVYEYTVPLFCQSFKGGGKLRLHVCIQKRGFTSIEKNMLKEKHVFFLYQGPRL